ncbi:hypothetical protein K7X08_015553 [Anisodus acutangulus]|uniref:PH domain-containing protein n=1 Tax=Anisodus acutangulus TaxID=402998 RepID=A0A9Q1L2M7_9SOLA|nr:hypothetical protein K7X08_015553 [Anisodus acutangulus]
MGSCSDDRRFLIITGKKKLQLRAESKEDRLIWLEGLFAARKTYSEKILSSSSLRSAESYDDSSSSDSENEEVHPSEDGLSSFMRFVECDYPYVERREKLPEPVEEEKGISL